MSRDTGPPFQAKHKNSGCLVQFTRSYPLGQTLGFPGKGRLCLPGRTTGAFCPGRCWSGTAAAFVECSGWLCGFSQNKPQGPAKACRMAVPVVQSTSGGSRALRRRQQLSHLYPLSRAEVLAQVRHTVHGHLWVFLNQTTGKGRDRWVTHQLWSLGGSVLV